MATSQQLFQQIESLGEMPNFQQEVAKAYQAPVLKPLVDEAAGLESQYLTNLFQPFTQMGTGAADLSPAAKLSAMGQSMGRLGSRIGASNNMQNYFGAQIGDIANNLTNQFQQKRQNLLQLYQMANEREQAAKAAAERAAAMRAQQSMMSMYNQPQRGAVQGLTATPLPTLSPQQQQAMQTIAGKVQQGASGVQDFLNRNMGQQTQNVLGALGKGLLQGVLGKIGNNNELRIRV